MLALAGSGWRQESTGAESASSTLRRQPAGFRPFVAGRWSEGRQVPRTLYRSQQCRMVRGLLLRGRGGLGLAARRGMDNSQAPSGTRLGAEPVGGFQNERWFAVRGIGEVFVPNASRGSRTSVLASVCVLRAGPEGPGTSPPSGAFGMRLTRWPDHGVRRVVFQGLLPRRDLGEGPAVSADVDARRAIGRRAMGTPVRRLCSEQDAVVERVQKADAGHFPDRHLGLTNAADLDRSVEARDR